MSAAPQLWTPGLWLPPSLRTPPQSHRGLRAWRRLCELFAAVEGKAQVASDGKVWVDSAGKAHADSATKEKCCCAASPCTHCDVTPSAWLVTFAGANLCSGCLPNTFTNGSYTVSGSINGTYLLAQIPGSPCLWRYEETPPTSVDAAVYDGLACAGDVITTSLSFIITLSVTATHVTIQATTTMIDHAALATLSLFYSRQILACEDPVELDNQLDDSGECATAPIPAAGFQAGYGGTATGTFA